MKGLRTQSDLGLLVLRGEALLLLVVYGWRKFVGLLLVVSGRQPWRTWGFAALIAKVGFPGAVSLAVFVCLCESVGAVFIVIGLFTRVSAALTAFSMAGALYFSLRVGEASWHLAALYVLSFVALAVSGPGKVSIDQLLKSWRKPSEV